MSYKQDFYNSVYNTAKELGATETQAHMAASQASLETGYGKHVAGNNYFGIKAGSSYTGPTVTTGTTEVYNGTPTSITDTFRQYQGLQDSVAGYMDFMGSRFADAWNSPDLSTAADNLMNGKYGAYATDPAYTDKIKGIASRFDDGTIGLPAEGPVPDTRPESFPGYEPSGMYDLAQANMPGLLAGYEQQQASPQGIFDSALNSQQAMQTDGIMSAINPPSITPVQRAALSDISAMPSQQVAMAADPMQSVLSTAYTANGLTNGVTSTVPATPVVAPVDSVAPMGVDPAFAANGLLAGVPASTLGGTLKRSTPIDNAPVTNIAASPVSIAPQYSSVPAIDVASVVKFDPLQGTPMLAEDYTPAIAGPATTQIASAPVQQQQQAVKQAVKETAAAPVKQASQQPGWLTKVNETLGTSLTQEGLGAGLLGGAFGGPVGGLLGALAGNYVAKNGGLAGLLQSQPMTINNLGSGPAAMMGVYGPGAQRGNTFTANNGATVTALGNGKVSYTNAYGVKEVHDPNSANGSVSAVW